MQEARLLCWHPFSSAWYVKHINWGKWSRLSGGAIPQLSLPRHKCALRFCKKIPCRQEEERFRWWSDRLQHRRLRRFTGWSKLPATDPWCNWGENNTRGHWGLSGILISVVKAEHVALSINQASFKLVHYVAGDPITGGGKKSNSRHSHRMFLALMHCVNPLTIQFRARTPAVCSVPSACFQVPLALLPLRPHTSIVYPREWRESPAPSRVRNLPQRCGGGGETADGVRDAEQVNDGDNGEKEEPGAFQTIPIGRKRKSC